MRRIVSYGPALVVLLTVAVVLLAAPAAVRRIGSAQTSARIVLAQQSLDDDDILERLNRAVRNVAETVRPSVVHLDVIPSGVRRFSGLSTGTGWVYDASGHIVTNAHVVRGAARINVTFPDGRIVEAQEIHEEQFVADPYTDIAVLKVPASESLFPVRRATGIQPQQGDRIFAFGSPFGFRFSMSEGIVSGLGRDPGSASEASGYTNYIQTDAAVNPGNSGGPLVDIKGRVIGMNVAIATARSTDGSTANEGQSAGISFAIPLGTIESVVEQLITRGQVRRGYLGISYGRARSSEVYSDVVRTTGVRIDGVADGGPAEVAGLEGGDVILSIAGQATPSMPVMRSVITTLGPGQDAPVRVLRDGKTREFTVTLGELGGEALANANLEAGLQAIARYGIRFVDPRDFRRRGVSIDDPATIRIISEDSPASAAGFAQGQTVIRVGNKSVSSVQEFCIAVVEQGLLIGKRIPVMVTVEGEETSPAPRELTIQLLN